MKIYNNNYPLDAEDMVYDKEVHMYIMTLDYVKKRTGVDLTLLVNSPYIADKTTAAQNIMREISVQLYLYAYSYNMNYKDVVEYLMAKSPMARENIREAILHQLSYTIRNGKINEFAGINVSYNDKNAATPLEDMRGDRSIHPDSIKYLSMPLEDGEKILFSGNRILPHGIEYRQGY